MNIIKRSGEEVSFDISKIINAINKANDEMDNDNDKLSKEEIVRIAKSIEKKCSESNRIFTVEEIQDLVESELVSCKKYYISKAYILYRYNRNLSRTSNTTDEAILSIVNCCNEEVLQENSNKDPIINSTQRDYIAGEVSKDLTFRKLLPHKIADAHKKGIIHFHDADYFLQKMHNCCLINIKDMLENGTVISNTLIETPKSFHTACNIMTQIIAQVASSQYGGQSITLSHLAPFVDVTRKKIKKQIIEDFTSIGLEVEEEKINTIVERRVREEITKGVQTIQYQLLTLLTTNGQTPFVTIFMYLGEVEDQRTKDDLALIIEEVIKQRYQGVKNEKGIYITPAFPKLIFTLEEDNMRPDSKYYYLKQLAVKCSCKRLVPDYISEKKMKELKDGYTYSSMGCVDGKEIITYKFNNKLFVEGFERMWNRLSVFFDIKNQYDIPDNPNLYMDLTGVQIFDTAKAAFTNCKRIIRNVSNNWIDVSFSNGRRILCTDDHPFEIINSGVKCAKDLNIGDSLLINKSQYSEENYNIDPNYAWMLGAMICKGNYHNGITLSSIVEDEIVTKFKETCERFLNLNIETKLQERDQKETYKDLVAKSKGLDEIKIAESYFSSLFGGLDKLQRQIPNEVFEWNYSAKLSFLAGMIDADEYIDNNHNNSIVQLGTKNKELALQQLALAQSVRLPASLYYDSQLDRYKVEFTPSIDLVNYVVCQKKKDNFMKKSVILNEIVYQNNTAQVTNIIPINNKVQFSYDVTTESEHFEVSGIYSHNCRSFLAPWYDSNGNAKFWGRGNIGVVTINLPDVACSVEGDIDKFWELFDERLELCHEALLCRYNRLKGTKSDVAPIIWQYGALGRLKKGEVIDKLLVGGYMSISLGYAGLYECIQRLTGKSHTDPEVTPLALDILKYMNKKTEEWSKQDNLGYSIYGTPIESTTYKFAKCLQNRFGIIPEVTDHNYITNSFHVNVREDIDAFSKLKFESQFQELSTGGTISYVEVPNLSNNLEAAEEVVDFIYDNTLYAELNSKSDYCNRCGFDGEIQIVEDEQHKLIWECPQCGNRDQDQMHVARRTCGYIGSEFWNQGRTAEIRDRKLHL